MSFIPGFKFWAIANFAFGLLGTARIMFDVPWPASEWTGQVTVMSFCVVLFLLYIDKKGPAETEP